MAKIDKPSATISRPPAEVRDAARNAEAAAGAKTGAAADTFERAAGKPLAHLLPSATAGLGRASKVDLVVARLRELREAHGAAAAAEAAAGLAPELEGAEPDVGAARQGGGLGLASAADMAGRLGQGGAAFELPESALAMPQATTPVEPARNAGPAEQAGGASGPPVPGPRDALAGADALHKVRAPKTVLDGRMTRTELADGTIVETRTSRGEGGVRLTRNDVFYRDGTSSEEVIRTGADGTRERVQVTYDDEGHPVSSEHEVRPPAEDTSGNPGPDEPTESQKQLADWLLQQHNLGKHHPAGAGPRLPDRVNPGDPETDGPREAPRLDPGEGIVVNPPDEASPQARAITPEQAARLRQQLEDAVRGPGAPPGGDEGPGPGRASDD